MKKLILTMIAAFLLTSCTSPFFSSYKDEYYVLKNNSWEGYGKLNSSYQYGLHRFDFDDSDKVIHFVNNRFMGLYRWDVDYNRTFQLMAENSYYWQDVDLHIVNSYLIIMDGLELRKVYR